MSMQRVRAFMVLAAAFLAASQAGLATAQQSPARKPLPPRTQQAKEYFDMYEPARRLRMRRETCARKEQSFGAYCVKACRSGYVAMTGTKPPRCRSLTPLPAGQLPGPVRKEVDAKPRVPRPPARSEKAKPGW